MAVTSIGGHKNGQNPPKKQFYSQEWPTKTAAKSWRFLLRFGLLLSHFLCLFLLISPCFLLFHDILEPQNSPPNLVTGYFVFTDLLCENPTERWEMSKTNCWLPDSLKVPADALIVHSR